MADELQSVLDDVRRDPHTGADPIPGFSHTIWKRRMRDVDSARGKRGGFRLIYQVIESDRRVVPLLLYAKGDKADVVASEVQGAVDRALANHEARMKAEPEE